MASGDGFAPPGCNASARLTESTAEVKHFLEIANGIWRRLGGAENGMNGIICTDDSDTLIYQPRNPARPMSTVSHTWFHSPLGKFLLQRERARCRALVPSGYYPNRLQVGLPAANFLQPIDGDHRFFISAELTRPPAHFADTSCARAAPEAMPFADKTLDFIALPHTLDFCADPHAVLREASHILRPQGCLLLTGFNPLSLWSAVAPAPPAARRTGRRHRARRVQDWLALLGFELVGAQFLVYQPPLPNAKWRAKFEFMEHIGARWLPGIGAVYAMVARKHELAFGGRGARPAKWRPWAVGLPQPATRAAARNRLAA